MAKHEFMDKEYDCDSSIKHIFKIEVDKLKTNFCPKCKYYVDKRFIYKDNLVGIEMNLGYEKDCKFHVSGKEWICNFKEQDDGNDD